MFEKGKGRIISKSGSSPKLLKRSLSAKDLFDEDIESKPKKICFDNEMVIDEPTETAKTNYTQAIQLAIENGESEQLEILTKDRPKGLPNLTEIFINHPGMVRIALNKGMQIDSGKILQVVLNNLTFSKHEEIEKLSNNLSMDNLTHALQLNENLSNSPHKNNSYYLNNQKKWMKDNLKNRDSYENEKAEYQKINHELIKTLFSSSLVREAKTIDEWSLYFKSYPLPYTIANYLSFEKLMLWKELRKPPSGFFQNLELSIPEDIFSNIEESYLSVAFIS